MADSTTVTLLIGEWTNISGGAANGLMTNESRCNQLIKEAAAKPADLDVTGHTVEPGKSYNWSAVTQPIWARALPNQGTRPGTTCEVTTQA